MKFKKQFFKTNKNDMFDLCFLLLEYENYKIRLNFKAAGQSYVHLVGGKEKIYKQKLSENKALNYPPPLLPPTKIFPRGIDHADLNSHNLNL